jgi:hypothetical protein
MPGQFPIEVLLSSGYAMFLLVVAAILEKLAKHSHRRAERYELAGFRYHPGFDRWECPAGNHLLRIETDHLRRVVRYRAPANDCNACAKKTDCTDSDAGREIEHRLDLWLQTGVSQFHRGLSLALVSLAGLLLVVEAVRYPEASAAILLGALFLVVALAGRRLLSPVNESRARSTEWR